MYLTIRIFIAFILISNSSTVYSQIFEFEQSPPSVRWREIDTKKYKLIYAAEVEKDAQFVANILDRSMASVSETIKAKHRKITIILRNQSVISNGFVQLSPRRSEFLMTAPQQSDPLNWLESLAIHEYRHVAQMDKLTAKAPFELLGLAFFGISLPPWFYEGDAVIIETVLTPAGRGRLPSWEMPLRTNVLSGKNYSYQKNYLGSMKDITSGYYELGYLMTTKIQRDFSTKIVDSVLSRMAKVPIRPYNFSNSLRKFTGRGTKQWYTNTIEDVTQKWKEQVEENKSESYALFSPYDSTHIQNFYLPQKLNEKQLIVLSQNPKNTSSIITLDSLGKQQEITKTGRQTSPNFSYANGKITWDEIRYDLRFHKRDFNVINVYDIEHKKYRQLSHKSRYFSPTLNADATLIAAVEIDLNNEEFIALLDAETGVVLKRIPAPKGMHIQTPSFHPNGEKVVAVGVTLQGANLVEFSIPNSTGRILLTNPSQEFERPIYVEDQLLFKASFNGIDNLYKYSFSDQKIEQITNIKFGAFNPSYDASSNRLLFNNYQPNGYQVSQLNLGEIIPVSIRDIKNTFINYFEPLLAETMPINMPDSSNTKSYSTKAYKEINHLFNFHSISVGSDDFASTDDLKLGLLLLSDNLLNTMSIRVGASYNQKIHRPEFSTTISYQRYFPKFNFHFENSGQLSGIKLDPKSDVVTPVRWRENEVKFNVEIPLVFSRLNQVYQTGFAVGSSYTNRYKLDLPEIKDKFIKELKFPMNYEFYFNRNERRSFHDLGPRWGQNISLLYRTSPFDKINEGNAFRLRSTFYFPGVMRNHSLRARFNYQQQDGRFQYSNDIPKVSGYDHLAISLPKNTLLLDYRFPIAYPDWEIGALAYIKRIKGGFFSDYEDFADHNNFKPRTMGAELRADVNFLRFYLPLVDVGVRAIYINEPNDKKWAFEFGFSYSY